MRAFASLVVVLCLAACDSGGPETGPSLLFLQGIVSGPGGDGVAGAQVLAVVTRVGDTVMTGQEPTQTGADGRYRLLLGILAPPFDAVLDVYVTPSDTALLRPDSVVGLPVRFNLPEQRDTVRVNLTLEST